jgi:hypothetical protein
MIQEALTSERMRRIMQGQTNFDVRPPAAFTQAIITCATGWEATRDERHRPAGLLYHYCDANALLNILSNRRGWATSTKYMNDSTELLSLFDNLKTYTDGRRSTPAGEVLADIVDFYLLTVDTRQSQTIGGDRFACCFSEKGDLLSQWRAYGNNGRGYAIGFDPGSFRDLVHPEKPKMDLRKITYGEANKRSLVDALFDLFSPQVAAYLDVLDSTGFGQQSARNWLSMRFGECLFQLNEEVKHPAFVEEAEWRLYANDPYVRKFRVSADRIVPYVELDLASSEDSKIMPIREIVIGPRLDYEEAVNSLTTFTNSLGYGFEIEFVRSKAPFR